MTSYLPKKLLLLCSLFTSALFAQPSLQLLQQNLLANKQNTEHSFYQFQYVNTNRTQATLNFSRDMALAESTLTTWLKQQLGLREGIDELIPQGIPDQYNGASVSRLQQFYKGIKVEHGIIKAASVNNHIQLLQLEYYPFQPSLTAVPIISEGTALERAIKKIGADQYSWQAYPSSTYPEHRLPKGELVFVEDMYSDTFRICLAYKFDVYASSPRSRTLVYVDAINGKVVFQDQTIKHTTKKTALKKAELLFALPVTVNCLSPQRTALDFNNNIPLPLANALAIGDTRYSGQRTFFSDNVGIGEYQLKTTTVGNNTTVETRHCLNQPDIAQSDPFRDADNVWTAAEFPNNVNMGLDAHWGGYQAVNYWWKIHGRKSYDNNNGTVNTYAFYREDLNEIYDNASWDGTSLYLGEGQYAPNHKPWASADLIGHELGHAVCQYTANLVYSRESGALNEGFSDIWGACLENFIADTIAPLTKNIWLFGEDISYVSQGSLRSMSDPFSKDCADLYLSTARKWEDATNEGCPIPDFSDNDQCGVHTNSGVLNKWFHLIAAGGITNGVNVTALGISKAEKIAFFAEMMLTPNAGFEAARAATINAVGILASIANGVGITIADEGTVKSAWNAVGVYNDTVFNMANTPLFASNSNENFTAVSVGKFGHIWAGTANKGLYKYNGVKWEKAPGLTNHYISQIKEDPEGRIWIAQYGSTGAQANGGGINSFWDSTFESMKYYSITNGLPTRNIRGIYINTRLVFDTFKRVWATAFADLNVGVSRAGALVRGNANESFFDINYKPFKKIVNGVNQNNGFCQSLGGNFDEIWAFASSNGSTGGGQVLRYNTVDSVYNGFIDQTNSPFPTGFNVKAIYYDPAGKRWWLGMQTGGIYLRDSTTNSWINVNFPSIFPAGTIVNNHAITGDSKGNIYIGTNNGLIKFGTGSSLGTLDPNNESLYRLFTMATDGLPSNNVKAIGLDEHRSRLIIATDAGIVFKYNLCKECINAKPIISIAAGNWDDPNVWPDGIIPGEYSLVIVRHPVTINQNSSIKSLTVSSPGTITVKSGVNFTVEGIKYDTTVD